MELKPLQRGICQYIHHTTSLFYVQWEKVIIIEAVEIRLEKLVLNDTVFLKLSFSEFFSLFG